MKTSSLQFLQLQDVSISAFASLVGIPIGITSSTIGLKIYVIATGIKNLWVNNLEKQGEAWQKNNIVSKI